MNKERQSARAVWVIHGLALVLLLAAIYTGFRYSGSEYFSDAVAGRDYEDTAAFGNQVAKDIRNAISYSFLEARFETDGSLDLEKVVRTAVLEDGTEAAYTLQDALDYGREQGVYFDSHRHLVVGDGDGEEPPEDGTGKNRRSSRGESLLDGNFDATFSVGTTEEEIQSEKSILLSLLYQLSEYYELQNYLGDEDGGKLNFRYRFIYVDSEGETVVSTNAVSDLTGENVNRYGKYFSVASEKGRFWSSLPEAVNSEIFSSLQYNQLTAGGVYEILAAVDTSFPLEDVYQRGQSQYRQFVRLLRILMLLGGMLILALAASFAALVFLGRQSLKGTDLWYTEISLLCVFLLMFVLHWGIVEIQYGYSGGYYMDVVTGEVLFALAYFPAVLGLLSLIRRGRHRQFASRSLCWQAVSGLRESFRRRGDKWNSHRRILSVLLCEAVELILAMAAAVELFRGRYTAGGLLLAAVAFLNLWRLRENCRREREQKRIFERVESLSRGDVGRKLDPAVMTGEMRQIGATVNALDESLERAVAERTASERMRTDLIANVSHDLRTPLTSIINYVDLLKRENLQEPRAQEYLRILEEKADRLKSMAEALMEANRVASGNITVEWSRIDLVQLLNQVQGEFQERMESAGLIPVVHLVEPPAIIRADGKLLWRVFDNLYSNVCKYAQPGTRVYVTLDETAHSLIYTMKNVSASPLNVPPGELTERFIRGDAARTGEGCGLGLSIARSMTELLHGRFELFLDGDYFRVRLVFPGLGKRG